MQLSLSFGIWTALLEHGKLQAGQRILIQGASGGVGGFTVQFAKFDREEKREVN